MTKVKKYRNVNTGSSFSKNKGDILFYCLILIIPLTQIAIFYFGVNFQSIMMAFQRYVTTEDKFYWDPMVNFNQFGADIGDKTFWNMIGSSFIVWLFTQFAGTILALLFSFYIYKKKKLYKFFKFVLFLPSIIPALLLVLIFKFFIKEATPAFFNFPNTLMEDSNTFFWLVTGFTVWISFGSQVLIYSGAMDQVPVEILEAGKIDGASQFREFIQIVIPYIAPTIATFLPSLISSFLTTFLRKSIPPITPSASSPSHPTPVEIQAPIPSRTNLYSFYGERIPDESFRTIGYELYRLVSKSGNGMSKYCYASFLGLISTCVAVPLTFVVRKILSKVGER